MGTLLTKKLDMSKPLQAIIIDDEHKARLNLRTLLADFCPEIEVVQDFEGGESAMAFLLKSKVDVVFLDIRMPGMTGFELLKNIKIGQQKIVIVSAHDDHGIEAVKAGAFDYLLKPLAIADLRELVQRLEQAEHKHEGAAGDEADESEDEFKITVPHSYGFKILDYRTIIRIQSDNSYSEIHFVDGTELVVTKSLKEFEGMLSEKGFFRIHNKHLINLKHLVTFSLIDGGLVTTTNGSQLPVSRRRLKEFREVVKSKFNKLGP